MCTILLLEDDIQQRNNLKKMLYETNKKLKFYEAEDKDEALDICKRVVIDIFFVDISLKNSSGLDFAVEVRKIPKYELSWIIFLTTHMSYITQAFKEVHCYDYILKPYDKEHIIDMAEKLISHITRNSYSNNERKYVIFDLKNDISAKIYIDEILFIEVRLRNCIIHTFKKVYTVNKLSLKKVIELMDCEDIIQCYRSCIVNVKYIRKIEKTDGKLSLIHFENYDETAPLGYKFKSIVMDKFK